MCSSPDLFILYSQKLIEQLEDLEEVKVGGVNVIGIMYANDVVALFANAEEKRLKEESILLTFLLTSSWPGHEVRRLVFCSRLLRSSASSLVAMILHRSRSTQFILVSYGLRGVLFSATSILNTLPNISVLLLLATRPYHLNLRTLISFRTSVSSHLCNISLLGILSRTLTPAINLIIILSQLLTVDSRFCISEAYSRLDHMQASYIYCSFFLEGYTSHVQQSSYLSPLSPDRCHSHLHCHFCSSLGSEHIIKLAKARPFLYSEVF